VAHRGLLRDLPQERENSLEALTILSRLGVWVELDVQATADRQLVVYHDATLERVDGLPLKIRELSLWQIQEQAPRIPTLESYLEAAGDVPLFIESKLGEESEFDRSFFDILRRFGRRPAENTYVMSFSLSALSRWATSGAWPSRGLVSIARTNVAEVARASVDLRLGVMTGHALLIDHPKVVRLAQNGVAVGTGFVDSLAFAERERRRGVRFLFSNRVQDLAVKGRSVPTESRPGDGG
jgi:glycerophosphoryl diester phosphodiesterase